MNFDDYQCVFYAVQDPRLARPVAVFDRFQFLMDFIISLRGEVEFREDNHGNDILTVRQWKKIYNPKQASDQ